MASKRPTESELIETARIFVENHLNGYLTPNELQRKLGNNGLNYTKLHRNNTLIFVIRGNGVKRTELKF